jgi:hypothetical protein
LQDSPRLGYDRVFATALLDDARLVSVRPVGIHHQVNEFFAELTQFRAIGNTRAQRGLELISRACVAECGLRNQVSLLLPVVDHDQRAGGFRSHEVRPSRGALKGPAGDGNADIGEFINAMLTNIG